MRAISLALLALSASNAFGTDVPLLQRAKSVLAKIEGDIAVPGLKEPVEVLRDRWGVPHIYAKNADDLFFAQGFVAAQDRLFQLDMWRRIAVGETAEVIGPEGIEVDRFARLLRYRGDMEAEWRSYSPDTQKIATAFTRGINAYIACLGGKLPIEFQLLRIAPKEWQPEDILGRMSGIVMSRNMQQEVARAQLINKVGLEHARRLAPTDPPVAFAPAPGLNLAGIDARILAGYQAVTKALQFKPSSTESNNWVVAGQRSLSGKPLLASDPHRAITLPSLRYLVHLNAPGWNVIGAGEPALPGIALGHNERIAWGITIVCTDQADLYVEEVNPANRAECKADGKWQPMKIVRETLRVKGEAEPRTLDLKYTRHGPVLFEDGRRAFALKWAGSEPGGAAYLGGLAVARAQNKQEFLEALKCWKLPGLNFVYADKDDNIGWVAAALTPVRPKHDGLLPVPGDGGFEWQRYLEVGELPQSFNPKTGYLATANHKILPPGYKHAISYEWAAPYRFERVKQVLEAKTQFDLKDFQALQHDVVSLPAQGLIRILKKVDLKDEELQPYADLLARWDSSLTREAKAGPLYAYWLRELEWSLFGGAAFKESATLRSLTGVPVLLAVLEKPSRAWFDDDDPVAARDRLVRDTLTRAVLRLRKDFGDPRELSWGKLHTVTFRHPLAKAAPEYGQAFNHGPVERPGETHTVHNARYDESFQQIHGASYRQLFDLANWDRGLATSTPGQSGQPGSPHYGDLLPLWAEGQYFPLAYSRGKVEEVRRHRLVLRP